MMERLREGVTVRGDWISNFKEDCETKRLRDVEKRMHSAVKTKE